MNAISRQTLAMPSDNGIARGIWWTAVGAVSGGACGAILGTMFGAALMLLDGDGWSITSVMGYFALCGSVAGALVAAAAALIDSADAPKAADEWDDADPDRNGRRNAQVYCHSSTHRQLSGRSLAVR